LPGLGNTPTTNNIASAESDGLRVVVRDLVKSYRLGDEAIDVLQGLSLSVSAGEIVSIMGPSGSGKTTLLNCISGIDSPDGGDVSIAGKIVDYTSERARTNLRRHDIGMVFQFFNLVPTLTVRENVGLPFLISRQKNDDADERVQNILERVGIARRADHRPYQLSGGEMQLASIARALAHQPAAILADEPTGNVNPAVGRSIMNTLREVAKSEQTAVLLVTHSPEHAAWSDRVCFLKEGVIAAECVHDGNADNVRPIHETLLKLGI
jgi:putative ABC transport system ATP-binding protein